MRNPLPALILCLAAGTACAGEVQMRFDARLLGVPVGQLRLAARERDGGYGVTSTFATKGLASIVDAGFRLTARGRITRASLAPSRYEERIDTGSRRSTVQLSYHDGVPRITGGNVAAEVAADPEALDPAAQTDTVDPLTALYGALRARPAEGLCRYGVTIFDGQRRATLAMSGRRDEGGRVTCTGAYTRRAGFSASEMQRQRVYPFAITYAPAGGLMRAQALTVRSSYGTARLIRK